MVHNVTCSRCDERFVVVEDPDRVPTCPMCGAPVELGEAPDPEPVLDLLSDDEPKKEEPKKWKRRSGRRGPRRRIRIDPEVDREHVPVFIWYLAATALVVLAMFVDFFWLGDIHTGHGVYHNPYRNLFGMSMSSLVASCVAAARYYRGRWIDDSRDIHEPPNWLVFGVGLPAALVAIYLGIQWRMLFVGYAAGLIAALWYVLRHKLIVYREEFAELSLMFGIWFLGMLFLFSPGPSPPAPAATAPASPAAPASPPAAPAGPTPPPTDAVPAAPVVEEAPLNNEPGTQYLSDLTEQGYVPGPWAFGKKGELGNAEHKPIQVGGIRYTQGLGMHPPLNGSETKVSYVLDGKAQRLRGGVAIDDAGGPFTPVRFKVYGDDRCLWTSMPVKKQGVPEEFDIDVSGVQVLQLRVSVDGLSNHGCHAVWLDPFVVTE